MSVVASGVVRGWGELWGSSGQQIPMGRKLGEKINRLTMA
jgi:hypothetical protein